MKREKNGVAQNRVKKKKMRKEALVAPMKVEGQPVADSLVAARPTAKARRRCEQQDDTETMIQETKKKKKKKKKNDMEERESKVQAACVSPKDQPKQTTKKLKKERLKDNKQEPDRPKAGKKRKRTEQARDSAVALTEPIEPRQPAAKAAQRTTSEADTTATDDSAVRDDLTEKPKTDWHAPPLPHMRGKPFTKEEDKLLLELAQDALRNKGLEPGSEEVTHPASCNSLCWESFQLDLVCA
eukprot:scaffold897_cov402-Prasinococcus_capsulatus_cf.AAC.7